MHQQLEMLYDILLILNLYPSFIILYQSRVIHFYFQHSLQLYKVEKGYVPVMVEHRSVDPKFYWKALNFHQSFLWHHSEWAWTVIFWVPGHLWDQNQLSCILKKKPTQRLHVAEREKWWHLCWCSNLSKSIMNKRKGLVATQKQAQWHWQRIAILTGLDTAWKWEGNFSPSPTVGW